MDHIENWGMLIRDSIVLKSWTLNDKLRVADVSHFFDCVSSIERNETESETFTQCFSLLPGVSIWGLRAKNVKREVHRLMKNNKGNDNCYVK